MDSVTLKDFRCFRGEQTARMAPLTLLVGENSTGKTSFLAILRALWEVAVNEVVPDFRREPYDLGAFSEIVYNDSSRGEQPDSFQAGFRDSGLEDSGEVVLFRITFKDVDGVTFPVSRFVSVDDTYLEISAQLDPGGELRLGVGNRSWKMDSPLIRLGSSRERLIPVETVVWDLLYTFEHDESPDSLREAAEQYGELSLDEGDIGQLKEWQRRLWSWRFNQWHAFGGNAGGPFAGAPVRSKPRRTYDPSRPIPDPEGEYIPSYLSMTSRRDPNTWKKLKQRLEHFGTESGLFDEISIESFGQTGDAGPFQIQIRKYGGKLKGNRRNLIDVGYGVSQALPIITELLRPDAPRMFLLAAARSTPAPQRSGCPR